MCINPESPVFDASMERLLECGLAISRGETSPLLYLEYAEALWNVRDLPATLAALDCAIGGTPPLPRHELSVAHASRAICYLQMGRPEAARTDATAALDLSPRGHVYALRAMANLFLGNEAEAIADAETGVRLDPEDWECRAWRGMIFMRVGRYAEAIADIDWVLATGECTRYASELYLERARAHLALGNASAAVADCSAAIDEDYHEQSHWPFIVRSRVERAHEPYLVRAEAQFQLGNVARALGDCFFAASITPNDPAIYDLRARVYYAAGNLQEAIRDTARAEYLRPKPAGPSIAASPAGAERPVAASA